MITVIAGGTGSAKIVRAIAKKVHDIHIISNVADNIWLMGLYVCPDIDTIVYALSGCLDIERGWGIAQDSFNFLKQLDALGYEAWFKIGDKDLVTHVIRTKMMREGHPLSSVTRWMSMRYNIEAKIIPFTDDHVETRIITEKGEMHLQEFWVKNLGKLGVKGIRYHGLETSAVNKEAVRAINDSETIVIAPGNPISSIGPIVTHTSIRDGLIQNRLAGGARELRFVRAHGDVDQRRLFQKFHETVANFAPVRMRRAAMFPAAVRAMPQQACESTVSPSNTWMMSVR